MGSAKLRFDELTLEGVSRAGDETWFRIHPPGLALDVGRGASELTGASDIFLTHGHLDHSAGLPWVLSQRALQGLDGPRIHCPAETAGALEAWLRATEGVDGGRYDRQIVGMVPGDRVEVGRNLTVEAFATEHGVPSLGYHLIRRDRRLRPELQGLAQEALLRRKAAGEAIDEAIESLWLTYCGDTGEAVFDLEPRMFESRILLLECTFLDDGAVARAGEYGHIHLDQLVSRATSFRNEYLVLHHLSRRHSTFELAEAARRRLDGLSPEVLVFPESA